MGKSIKVLETKTLGVVSHVLHYVYEGKLYAYGPYSKEIDMLAELFKHVIILAPCKKAMPPKDALSFKAKNISIIPQVASGGTTVKAKIKQVLLLPWIVGRLVSSLRRVDAVQVRCPGNLGVVGVFIAPLFKKNRFAKYAGQWNGFTTEKWTITLQRWGLRNWWNAPVFVYGVWPNQPAHIIASFTSMMTKEQVQKAKGAATIRRKKKSLSVLYTGRLAPEKRVAELIKAVASLGGVELIIVGDGEEKSFLEKLAEKSKAKITFRGALSHDDTLKAYETADCFVLPSTCTEGWPKALAEAMCYGCICIAVKQGAVTNMLQERGILLENGSAEEIAKALSMIIAKRDQLDKTAQKGAVWAQQFSLPAMQEQIKEKLLAYWSMKSETNTTRN